MSDEKKLQTIQTAPNQDVIGHIENLLEHAKCGELQGIAYVGSWDDTRTSSSWCLPGAFNKNRTSAVIGELEKLKMNMLLGDEGLYSLLHELRDG